YPALFGRHTPTESFQILATKPPHNLGDSAHQQRPSLLQRWRRHQPFDQGFRAALPNRGQMEIDQRCVQVRMPQIALNGMYVDASFQQMRGVTMAQSMHPHSRLMDTGSLNR